MNSFDSSIINFLNGFAHVSYGFDYFMNLLSSSYLLKGGILVAILWWFWFLKGENGRNHVNHEYILSTLGSGFLAIFFARTLALTLPFRYRPLHDPSIKFQIPYTLQSTALDSWSSFPSDHAALFFALATGIWLISRRIGIISFVYVTLVIFFPRIYLGLHYPTDILAGVLMGYGMARLVNADKIRSNVAKPFLHWAEKSPGSFYACLFLLTFQIASLFDSLRAIAKAVFELFRRSLF